MLFLPRLDFPVDVPTLCSARLRLRPMDETDLPDLAALWADPRVMEHLSFGAIDAKESAWLQQLLTSLPTRSGGVRWVLRTRDGGDLVGTAGFHAVDAYNARMEVGYELAPAFWRQGYASEALVTMLSWAWQNTGVHRIEALVTPGNAASTRLLERHGFGFEGVLRGYAVSHDVLTDQLMYARLRTDEAVSAAHPVR